MSTRNKAASTLERAAIRWAHAWARENGWIWRHLVTHYPFNNSGWKIEPQATRDLAAEVRALKRPTPTTGAEDVDAG